MWDARKWVFGCGIFSLFLGSTILIFHTTIFSYIIELFMRLNGKSYIFEFWRTVPVDIPTRFTFFNWTNHEDFFEKDIKPQFEEVGPYQFLQRFQKVDIVVNDNNTNTYKQIRTFRYDDNFENNGNLSDKIITLNYFPMIIFHHIRYWNDLFKDALAEYLSVADPNYYSETTVDEETISGFDNLILELYNYFDFIAPEFLRMERFGWIKMRNGDPNFDGVFNTGNGINREFDIFNWNYYSNTPYFKEPCSKVRGSTGEIHSRINKDYIDVFATDACRYVRLYFEKEVIIDGIIGHKYSATEKTFDNGTLVPENECFRTGDHYPSGLMNFTACTHGINVHSSMPHFHLADDVYLNAVEGLHPNKSLHEAYIVVEPNTRVCLDFRLRVQINILTQDIGVTSGNTIPKLYFPLFWLEQSTEMPKNLKEFLKTVLNFPYFIIAAGSVLTFLGLCLTGHSVYKIIQPYRLKKAYINTKRFSVMLQSIPFHQTKK